MKTSGMDALRARIGRPRATTVLATALLALSPAAAGSDSRGPSSEDIETARVLLRACIAGTLENGGVIYARVPLMGATSRVKLLSADADALHLKTVSCRGSIDASFAWEKITDATLVACAWEALPPGDVDFLFAALTLCASAGIEDKGGEALSRLQRSQDGTVRGRAAALWSSRAPAKPRTPATKTRKATRSRTRSEFEPPAWAPSFVEPANRPALPEEIAPFNVPDVPQKGAAADGVPTFAEWTRTAEAGDVIVATGWRLSALCSENTGRDAEVMVYGQNGSRKGVLAKAQIVQWAEPGCAIRIPDGMPPESMYLVWVRNRYGLSKPAVINRAEAWWMGPDTATRGGTARIHGRNLTLQPSTHEGDHTSWVYFRPPTGRGAWCKVVAANPYRIDFVVPTGATNGTFEVWVHNGRGGAYGWSGPLSLTIVDPPPFTANVIPVNARDGADITAVLEKAISSARGRGSTVRLPPGTFTVSRTIKVGSTMRLCGSGMDATTVKTAPGFPAGSPIVSGGGKHIEIWDIAFESNPSPKRKNSGINIRGSSDCRYVNVRILNHQGAALDLQGNRRMFVEGCDLAGGSPVFSGASKQIFFDGCTFQGMYDANSLVASWGGSYLSMTNCTGKDYDNSKPTGWGSGRFYVSMSHWGANRCQYFAGNRSVDLCVRDRGDQNSGEQFLWELGTNWQGMPTAATATTVTFADGARVRGGHEIAIVMGTGIGQNRRVVSVKDGVVTVAPAWNVPPDETSLLVAGGFADRIVFYKNDIDGKPRGMKGTASCAVNAYGCTFNMVADSNTCHETNGSFSNFGRVGGSVTSQQGSMVMPVYFSLYQNNRMDTCSMGTINLLNNGTVSEGDPVLILGAVSRRNTFVNVPAPVATYGRRGKQTAAQLNVFDLNVTEHGRIPTSVQ